jgi:hypothetical protein
VLHPEVNRLARDHSLLFGPYHSDPGRARVGGDHRFTQGISSVVDGDAQEFKAFAGMTADLGRILTDAADDQPGFPATDPFDSAGDDRFARAGATGYSANFKLDEPPLIVRT